VEIQMRTKRPWRGNFANRKNPGRFGSNVINRKPNPVTLKRGGVCFAEIAGEKGYAAGIQRVLGQGMQNTIGSFGRGGITT